MISVSVGYRGGASGFDYSEPVRDARARLVHDGAIPRTVEDQGGSGLGGRFHTLSINGLILLVTLRSCNVTASAAFVKDLFGVRLAVLGGYAVQTVRVAAEEPALR